MYKVTAFYYSNIFWKSIYIFKNSPIEKQERLISKVYLKKKKEKKLIVINCQIVITAVFLDPDTKWNDWNNHQLVDCTTAYNKMECIWMHLNNMKRCK